MEIEAYSDTNFEIEYQREFNKVSNIVNSLYSGYYKDIKLKFEFLRKISIEFVERKNELVISKYSKDDPVCCIWISFDYKLYSKTNNKKKLINDNILNALNEFGSEYGIDNKYFYQAYKKVIDLQYGNKFFHGKKIVSKDKNYKGIIQIELEEDYAIISSIIYDYDDNVLQITEIIKTLPHEYFYERILGRTLWKENEFLLLSKTGEIIFISNLDDNRVQITFKPKERTKKELSIELEVIDYTTSEEERKELIKSLS